MGATEQLLIMYGLQLFFAIYPMTNEYVDQPIDFKGRFGFDLPFSITGTHLLAVGASFVPAIQYNGANMWIGFNASKDKLYAILCALPFFQLYVCLFLASQYSQFWTEYCALFLFGFGNWLTHVTGYLNLMSSSKSKFNPLFADPFVFCVILYADHLRLVPAYQLAFAYIFMIILRMTLYILFMRSMIVQICDYCKIPFIRVKQDLKPREDDKKRN